MNIKNERYSRIKDALSYKYIDKDTGQSKDTGWYDTEGILAALYDYLPKDGQNDNTPVILVQNLSKEYILSDEKGNIDEKKIKENINKEFGDREVILIRNKDNNHWYIEAIFNDDKGQKKVLAFDPIKESIQQDDISSCGPIVVEMAKLMFKHMDQIRLSPTEIDWKEFLEKNNPALIDDIKNIGIIKYDGKMEERLHCIKIREEHLKKYEELNEEAINNLILSGSQQKFNQAISKESVEAVENNVQQDIFDNGEILSAYSPEQSKDTEQPSSIRDICKNVTPSLLIQPNEDIIDAVREVNHEKLRTLIRDSGAIFLTKPSGKNRSFDQTVLKSAIAYPIAAKEKIELFQCLFSCRIQAENILKNFSEVVKENKLDKKEIQEIGEFLLKHCSEYHDGIKDAFNGILDKKEIKKIENNIENFTKELRNNLKNCCTKGDIESISIDGSYVNVKFKEKFKNHNPIKISEFLNNNFCKSNGISGLSIEGGIHVCVSHTGCRHYIVSNGSYEMNLKWQANGVEQNIKIHISSDGTVRVDNEYLEQYESGKIDVAANKDMKIGSFSLFEALEIRRWKENRVTKLMRTLRQVNRERGNTNVKSPVHESIAPSPQLKLSTASKIRELAKRQKQERENNVQNDRLGQERKNILDKELEEYLRQNQKHKEDTNMEKKNTQKISFGLVTKGSSMVDNLREAVERRSHQNDEGYESLGEYESPEEMDSSYQSSSKDEERERSSSKVNVSDLENASAKNYSGLSRADKLRRSLDRINNRDEGYESDNEKRKNLEVNLSSSFNSKHKLSMVAKIRELAERQKQERENDDLTSNEKGQCNKSSEKHESPEEMDSRLKEELETKLKLHSEGNLLKKSENLQAPVKKLTEHEKLMSEIKEKAHLFQKTTAQKLEEFEKQKEQSKSKGMKSEVDDGKSGVYYEPIDIDSADLKPLDVSKLKESGYSPLKDISLDSDKFKALIERQRAEKNNSPQRSPQR